MAVDIGYEATNRPDGWTDDITKIAKGNPSTINGLITSIDIWVYFDTTGLKVGTFYTTNGNRLKCRASQVIAGTIIAGSKVTKAVSIAVEIGDYIGCYFPSGNIRTDYEGFDGVWYEPGDWADPGDERDYTLDGDAAISLGGYFAPVGWTGKISGVTNPAKIMGVDVANIKSVKGVE